MIIRVYCAKLEKRHQFIIQTSANDDFMKKSMKKLCCLLVASLGVIIAIEFCVISKPVQTHSRKIHPPVDSDSDNDEEESRDRGTLEEKNERPIDPKADSTDKYIQHVGALTNESSSRVKTSEFSLGKIRRGKKYLLIYNNVPKCGSRSLAHSIKDVLKKNHAFHGIEIKGDKRKGKDLEKSFQRIKTPAYISGHMPFVQPSRQDMVYINMIRDPIERFTSLYYFALNGDESGVKPEAPIRKNVTIDEYVKGGASIQSNIYFHFDRDDLNETDDKSEHLLERAKRNIERYYILVGLTEEINATVILLETLLPDLLHGLRRVYRTVVAEKRHDYATKNKVPPSNETIAILKEKLKDEYELYYFVKQHFSRLKKQYKVK